MKKPEYLQIVGRKKSGKTTLIVGLVEGLVARGMRVATIKHTSHNHEFDRPETDSWKHRKAGSEATIIISPDEWVCHARIHGPETKLLLQKALFRDKDIVLWEGHGEIDALMIECVPPGQAPLFERDDKLIAVVTDFEIVAGIPRFRPFDIAGIIDFLVARLTIWPTEKEEFNPAVQIDKSVLNSE